MNYTGKNRAAACGASLLLMLLAAAATHSGCSHGKPSVKAPTGILMLNVTPDNARVYIDERLQGTASMFNEKTLLISEGKHRLKLTADDYFPEYHEIEVTGKLKKIEIKMRKVPPPLYP